jgi:hypothetical protein
MLDPGDGLVGGAIGAIDDTLGLGGALAPVSPLVDGVTDVVDSVLAPLLGSEFTPNDPNEFDPLDNALNNVLDPLGGTLTPIVDGLLGTGVTAGLIHQLEARSTT